MEAGDLPLGVVSAPANRHDFPLRAPTSDLLKDLGPLPETTCVHLDAGYDSTSRRFCWPGGDSKASSHTKGYPHRPRPPNAGRWNAPALGTTTSSSLPDAPNAGRSSPTSTSTSPTPSSWSADSYAGPGSCTAGTPDPAASPGSCTAGTPDPAAGPDLLGALSQSQSQSLVTGEWGIL